LYYKTKTYGDQRVLNVLKRERERDKHTHTHTPSYPKHAPKKINAPSETMATTPINK
jgi:hypothetical protein